MYNGVKAMIEREKELVREAKSMFGFQMRKPADTGRSTIVAQTEEVKSGQGSFSMTNFVCEKKYSFADYIFGGCEIELSVAIDFSSSNGDPMSPNSLHHFKGNATDAETEEINENDSEYMKALKSVGKVLQFYNNDKQIALYGFGGNIKSPAGQGQRIESDCFALNGNIIDPRIPGLVNSVMSYKNAIQNT